MSARSITLEKILFLVALLRSVDFILNFLSHSDDPAACPFSRLRRAATGLPSPPTADPATSHAHMYALRDASKEPRAAKEFPAAESRAKACERISPFSSILTSSLSLSMSNASEAPSTRLASSASFFLPFPPPILSFPFLPPPPPPPAAKSAADGEGVRLPSVSAVEEAEAESSISHAVSRRPFWLDSSPRHSPTTALAAETISGQYLARRRAEVAQNRADCKLWTFVSESLRTVGAVESKYLTTGSVTSLS
mmetsp:Transcript_7704/g.15479  ORF Transcript_7704/g.15479 Transcript_7704/m.15479 type:complete len:252 (-) Transcript_7704:6477-7232(-)